MGLDFDDIKGIVVRPPKDTQNQPLKLARIRFRRLVQLNLPHAERAKVLYTRIACSQTESEKPAAQFLLGSWEIPRHENAPEGFRGNTTY